MNLTHQLGIRITFIEHSSFLVEMNEASLLFDYFGGELPPIPTDKPLFVFASHKHGDHYSPAIFDVVRTHPDVQFILSREIHYLVKKLPVYEALGERICFVRKWETHYFPCGRELLQVETLRSTDLGVAFIVTQGIRTIYHAGDLHWWDWTGETDTERHNMEVAYKKELARIEGRHLDVAFVPVDGRLEETWHKGAAYFMEHTQTAHLIPMHSWEDLGISRRFKEGPWAQAYQDKVEIITHKGQIIPL